MKTINKLHLVVGFSFLFLGFLYYYLFRLAEHTYFIQLFKISSHLNKASSIQFSTLGESLPTFIHVFAFSLLTAGLIANRKKEYWGICLFWFGINVLFELGQKFHSNFIQFIPDWFSDIVFLENTKSYFLKGSFDYLDIFSIALGAFVAYIFLITTTQKRRGEMKNKLSVAVKSISILFVFALGVVSIIGSGGGGGGGTTPVDTTAAAGLWHGTMTNADNNTFTIGGLISTDGQLRFVVDEEPCIGTQYISSSFTLNDDTGSGSFTGLTTGECFFEDNSTKTSGTFDFTATADNVTGTYTAGNDSGTFTLTNNHEAEVAITLADLEGNWGYDLAPDYFSHITISGNGSLTGTDDSGCNYSGQVSIIDPDFSITNVSVTASSCPEPTFNGTYSGLGFLDTTFDEFVVLLSDDTFPIFDVLNRLP